MLDRLFAHRTILVVYVTWVVLVLGTTTGAIRYEDEADYLNAALQLARGEVSLWHADFFNYDKEFGSYWFLSWVLRAADSQSAVLAANLAQAIAFCLSIGALFLYKLRYCSLTLILPFLLSPVFVLYAMFFGTCTISLAFLFLAFATLSRSNRFRLVLGCLLIVIAAACRADVVLVIPTLILSQLSRRPLLGLLRSPIALAVSASAILPPVVGLVWTVGTNDVFQTSLPYGLLPIAPFVCFGLGVVVLICIAWSSIFFLLVAKRKARGRVYYLLRALSPLIPLGFYIYQLATPQHFLLTLACYLFTISDRRSPLVFWWLRPGGERRNVVATGLILVVVVPWFIGLKAPTLQGIRLTFETPQVFPTSHGHFPMGAYASYMLRNRQSGYILDHNEKIFLAAERARYEPCDGKVPVLLTPMHNYLTLAVRLENLLPKTVNDPSEISCGYAYTDARSLLRNDLDVGRYAKDGTGRSLALARHAAALVAADEGQAILRVDTSSSTELGSILGALNERFLGREIEFEAHSPDAKFALGDLTNGGMVYALTSGKCAMSPSISQADVTILDEKRLYLWDVTSADSYRQIDVTCPGDGLVGEVKLTLPSWMAGHGTLQQSRRIAGRSGVSQQ
jgi:hypothetical protein